MNYQHLYHAGSHADVFKHLVLMALIEYFAQKDKPFCVIDTHAGNGVYNLTESPNQEWQAGVGKLPQTAAHPLLQKYINKTRDFSQFPGSPVIAATNIRPQDELILIEKAEASYQSLRKHFRYNKQVHVHGGDAYQLLLGLLPPKIKRGIMLIDPPYESGDELEKLNDLLTKAIKKFPTGCFALWLPIKSRALVNQFYQSLAFEKLICEFCPWPDDIAIRLNGSAMVIINPPYQLEKTLKPALSELLKFLKQDPKGFVKCYIA